MNRRIAAAACFLVLVTAGTASANFIAPGAFFFPGLVPFGFATAVPATLLAAFLERPFYTAAGVERSALWLSIQANVVSLIIGYAGLPCVQMAIYGSAVLAVGWIMAAVTVSVLSEGWYLYRQCGRELWWPPVVAGNAFSGFCLILIPQITAAIKEAQPTWALSVEPYWNELLYGSLAGSAVLIGLSFLVPWLRGTEPPGPELPAEVAADGPKNP